MRTILLNARICGFKCITTPLEIQFSNKNVSDELFDSPLVKAIYGTNGAGKSAVAYAFDVYHRTITENDFLSVENVRGNLKDMINKKNKSAYLDLYFCIKFGKDYKFRIYRHIIEYLLKDDEVIINHEKLLAVKGNSWGDENNESIIYEVKDGEFIDIQTNHTIKKAVIDKTKNLLTGRSPLFRSIAATDEFDKTDKADVHFSLDLISTYLFALFVAAFIDEKDANKMKSTKINNAIEVMNRIKQTCKVDDDFDLPTDDEIAYIPISDYKNYEALIKSTEKFIKIFKPNLKTIRIEKDLVGNEKYRCKKIMVYDDDTEVDCRFESSGIKKLIKLYPLLSTINYPGVLFIDEIDSNIHDVYLCKLIEYFAIYSKCQIIFTTHNLGSMEVLDDTKLKHTIDFINNSKITSWKKNGNYSVVNVYRSGAIPNCPFNINSADFVGVMKRSK